MKFRLNNDEATFNICRSRNHSGEHQPVFVISYRVQSTSQVQNKELLSVDALAVVIMNFESDSIEEYGSSVAALERGDYHLKSKKL